MAYVVNRTIHDVDAHVLEFPDATCELVPLNFRDEFMPYMAKQDEARMRQMKGLHGDPDYSVGARELMLHRGNAAIGAFRREDIPKTAD